MALIFINKYVIFIQNLQKIFIPAYFALSDKLLQLFQGRFCIANVQSPRIYLYFQQKYNKQGEMGCCASDLKLIRAKQQEYCTMRQEDTQCMENAKQNPERSLNIKLSKSEIMDLISDLFRKFDSNFSGYLQQAEIFKMLLSFQRDSKTGMKVTASEVDYLLQHASNPENRRISRQDLFNFYLKQ